MIQLYEIASILRDGGYTVRLTKTHGYIGDVLFTSEYARFGKNPNLYYYKKQDPASAAAFIDKGCTSLEWTEEDLAQSLECEKDELYFVCQLYQKLVKKPTLTYEERSELYYLFKTAMKNQLDDYIDKLGLHYNGMDLKCSRALGRHYGDTNHISFNSDLIMYKPNYIKSVILHEMCHISYHNHRYHFWWLLEWMMCQVGLTSISGYVVPELFARRKDYYITLPFIPGGPDLRYKKCIPHPNIFKDIKAKDK